MQVPCLCWVPPSTPSIMRRQFSFSVGAQFVFLLGHLKLGRPQQSSQPSACVAPVRVRTTSKEQTHSSSNGQPSALIVSLLGYTCTVDEVMLVMNFVDGANLDQMLFGKVAYREVSEFKPSSHQNTCDM